MAHPERLLISALLIHRNMTRLLDEGLTSDVLVRNRAEMLFLEKNGIPSIATFKSKFPDFKILKVDEADIPFLVNQCRSNRIRSELVKVIKGVSLKVRDDDIDVADLATETEGKLRALGLKYGSAKDIDIIGQSDIIFRQFKERRRRLKRGDLTGIPYNVPAMDSLMGGMQKTDMITVAARMGNLKTWFLLRMAASALLNDKRVLFVSLEMSKEQIAFRLWTLLSYMSQQNKIRSKLLLPNTDLEQGRTDEKKLEVLLRYFRDKINGSFIVPDIRGKFSISMTRYKIEQHNPDIVFFDYFGLAVGKSGKVDNWMEASAASNECKEMARTYELPFVLASQINRAGAEGVPGLQHISVSDSIGADSDRVFTLKKMKNETLLLSCVKNRHGRDGWRIYFDIDLDRGKLVERKAIIDDDDEDD